MVLQKNGALEPTPIAFRSDYRMESCWWCIFHKKNREQMAGPEHFDLSCGSKRDPSCTRHFSAGGRQGMPSKNAGQYHETLMRGVLESPIEGVGVFDRPNFEPANGDCEVQKCPNPAKYRATWPYASKLVCENHRKLMTDKPWPAVSSSFGGKPPK